MAQDDALERAMAVYRQARQEERELSRLEVQRIERYMEEFERAREEEHDRQTRR